MSLALAANEDMDEDDAEPEQEKCSLKVAFEEELRDCDAPPPVEQATSARARSAALHRAIIGSLPSLRCRRRRAVLSSTPAPAACLSSSLAT